MVSRFSLDVSPYVSTVVRDGPHGTRSPAKYSPYAFHSLYLQLSLLLL
jgi:hypothetical protein